MPENQEFQRPVRRRKQVPKWKRMLRKYWPPIRMALLLSALILLVVMLVNCVGGDGGEKAKSAPSKEPTETTQKVLSKDEIQAEAEQLVSQADFIAAGYDYTRAIEMLESFEYYDQVPALADKVAEYQQADSKLVTYPDMSKVTHVFFHSLVVDTARAFDDEYTNAGYNQYMTTIDEFVAMMEEMYARDFVLVSPYDVAYEVSDEGGTRFVYGKIRLPEGKKPFIMSQDDVNYYGYMIGGGDGKGDVPGYADVTGDGFATRIVIGEDGYPTCEYMDANGNISYGDYDLVPILEKFIQKHPDFSYHGARAVLGVTGYEGVWGYRTKPAYETAMGTEAYQKEIEDAKKVTQCLKDHGWIVASHSYGHPSYGNISAEKVRIDSDKWENTVQPVVGNCDIILYPNGSDIAGVGKYTMDNEKFQALYEDGYRYFFNVDSSVYWAQLGENYYRGGRRNLDGYRMYYHPDRLRDLFDTEKLFDPARPTPVPKL